MPLCFSFSILENYRTGSSFLFIDDKKSMRYYRLVFFLSDFGIYDLIPRLGAVDLRYLPFFLLFFLLMYLSVNAYIAFF